MTKKELQKIKRRGVSKKDIPVLIKELEKLQDTIITIFAFCAGQNTFWTSEEVIHKIETMPEIAELVDESMGKEQFEDSSGIF